MWDGITHKCGNQHSATLNWPWTPVTKLWLWLTQGPLHQHELTLTVVYLGT